MKLKSVTRRCGPVFRSLPAAKIYYSGDSGYGPHFKAIGDEFGPVDLAIMENGQYDQDWKYIHMMPDETAQAAAICALARCCWACRTIRFGETQLG